MQLGYVICVAVAYVQYVRDKFAWRDCEKSRLINTDHQNSIVPFPLFHGKSSIFVPSGLASV